ncbi:MAG TPA: hypothetical protein DEG92_03360 [Rikenellaceae bacterium]|nr:hypothetical protein [Rikenellaceae bacterium]
MGYGSEKIGNFIDMGSDYVYRINFYRFQYNYTFLKGRSWSLEAVGLMQFNTVKYMNKIIEDQFTNGYEFGINGGLALRKLILKDNLSFYLLITSGPHYISGAPNLQIQGFIFSNNIYFGIDVKVAKRIYLNFGPGLRHISNAETRHPNFGINSILINGGIVINLQDFKKGEKRLTGSP